MKKPDWLPDWFDLKNYDSVARMDLLDWAIALQFREFIKSKQAREVYDSDELLVERLAYVSKAPDCGLSCWHDDADEVVPMPVGYDSLGEYTVKSPSVGMFGIVWGDIIDRGGLAKIKKDLEVGRVPKDTLLAERYERLQDITYDEFYLSHFQKEEDGLEYNNNYLQTMGGFAFAQIDIGAPDEQLIGDFKKWIADIRKQIGISSYPQNFTSADLADWHAKQVLPYIDLTIWAKLMDRNITQQEIGIVLFPDDYNISLSDRVRRTVKPLAEKLMMSSTVGAISMQAGLPYY